MRAYVIGAFVLTASWAAACGSDDEGEGALDPTDGGGSGGTAGSSTGGTGGRGGSGGTGGRGSGGTPSGGTGNAGGTLPDGSLGSGGSGDASTDGGVPEGSAGDASVANDATSDGAAPIVDAGACAVLEACCDTVQPIFEASCRQSASTSTAQECTALQGFFCGAAVPEGGGPPQPDAGSCTALQDCCDQLTGMQQTQCNTIVGLGNPVICTATMGTYCP